MSGRGRGKGYTYQPRASGRQPVRGKYQPAGSTTSSSSSSGSSSKAPATPLSLQLFCNGTRIAAQTHQSSKVSELTRLLPAGYSTLALSPETPATMRSDDEIAQYFLKNDDTLYARCDTCPLREMYCYIDEEGIFMEDMICAICTDPLVQPCVLPCGHYFCHCCINQVKNNQCPMDSKSFRSSEVVQCTRPTHSVVLNLLDRIRVHCPYLRNGCPWRGPRGNLVDHIDTCEHLKCYFSDSCNWKGRAEELYAHVAECRYADGAHHNAAVGARFEYTKGATASMMAQEESVAMPHDVVDRLAQLQAEVIGIREEMKLEVARFQGQVTQQILAYLQRMEAADKDSVMLSNARASVKDYRVVLSFGSVGAEPGHFSCPESIAVDESGKMFVIDSGNNRFQVFSAEGDFLRQFGEHGVGPRQFIQPKGLNIDNQGRLLICDTGNHRIKVFTRSGIQKFGSEGTDAGHFQLPRSLATDQSGNMYVCDWKNHRVQVLSSDGNFLYRIGSQGSADGQFMYPSGIALDISGRKLYVTDSENHRVQVFSCDGKHLMSFGSQGSADGQFRNPTGICVDIQGRVYVADTDNHRVQVFSPDGHFLKKLGGLGSGVGDLSSPTGLFVTSTLLLYVTELGNHRVQVFVEEPNAVGGMAEANS